MSDITLRESVDFLRTHDNYLILTHIRPDGDTLGSAAALCHALRRMGKTAGLFRNVDTTEKYAPFMEEYWAAADYAYDTVISVDLADARMFPKGFEGSVDLAFDHHPNGAAYAAQRITWAHRSSCGELILAVLEEIGGITPEEADLLYMAVSTDTGCFVYANVNADTFHAAGRLTDLGARVPYLNNLLFRTKRRARLLLEGYIYSTLRSYKNDQLNIAVITLDMLEKAGAVESDCEDLAGLAGLVAGSRVSVTIRELRPGHSKVSMRSDGSVSCTEVCKRFGGGGHLMASGCELDLSGEETAEALRAAIEEVWP